MKLLALISGGIDSPVALNMFLRHNFEVECIIFENEPFSDPKELENALETIRVLGKKYSKKIKTHILSHGISQEAFLNRAEENELRYGCIFSRRMMLRISERIAKEIGAEYLITGDSMGQVASQTLDNLVLIGTSTKMVVLRPLLGYDKSEIVKIARQIGTYEASIFGGINCSANLDFPETHGKLEEILKIEKKFDLEKLIERELESRKTKII